ncbi:PTS sugar transporter subunit IIA [Brevibacillus fulvus]|uniref:PTS system glucose-specific IIA component n=1 Tax=Brevibacillus fulvus TaxID=1125967 RepID=A0A938XZS7_9BACL|nr:PTS glucose transporter subunit IIA [Brevibacillus fulvus]MBM7590756.1 PTS system glucose-specific IIA component [Brevibacillus fulvus]
MFNLFKKKRKEEVSMLAPVTGTVVPLEQVPDPVFSQKMAGDGIAIQPSEGLLLAPFNGKVAHLFHTSHAISLISEAGVELLIHIGIDTVKLDGKGFTPYVQTGDQVKAGDKLIAFDLNVLQEAGCPTITPILLTDETVIEQKNVTAAGAVTAGKDEVIHLTLK